MTDMTCKCCKEFIEAGAPHKLYEMVKLPRSSELKKLAVLVCPHCDGPVVQLAQRQSD